MIDHGEQAFGNVKAHAYSVHTLLIGTGAASLNCAEHLYELGVSDIAIVTDKLGAGTSSNSGSDKQTYYKIGIFGDVPDSPVDFAKALAAGGMMHGDLAYIEGLGSAPEFFHLVRNGVPFPFNAYGAFVGYKTDHDPRQRATSAGPKTSRFMVERALDQVRRRRGGDGKGRAADNLDNHPCPQYFVYQACKAGQKETHKNQSLYAPG